MTDKTTLDERAKTVKCAVCHLPAGHPGACNDCDPCLMHDRSHQLGALYAEWEDMYWEIRRLRAALPPTAVGGAWQDIETAPKDGTSILAFAVSEYPRDAYYGVAQWAEADPDFPSTVAGWFWPFAIRPTHWMPLPPPPAQGGSE